MNLCVNIMVASVDLRLRGDLDMMQNNELDGMPEYKLLYTQVARKMVGTNISVVRKSKRLFQ